MSDHEMDEYEADWCNDALIASTASKDELNQYCYGECHVLAIALHRLTGWPMHVVTDHAEPYWSSDDGEDSIPSVVHVLCIDHENHFWDIRGKRPRDTLHEEMMGWHPIMEYGSDTNCDEDDIRFYTGCWGEEGEDEIDRPLSEFSEADVEDAMVVVRRVLADIPGYKDLLAPVPAM